MHAYMRSTTPGSFFGSRSKQKLQTMSGWWYKFFQTHPYKYNFLLKIISLSYITPLLDIHLSGFDINCLLLISQLRWQSIEASLDKRMEC